MAASSTPNLLFVGVLVALSCGVSSVYGYKAFSDKQNYTEAHLACKSHGFEYLAKIKNPYELIQAKNITKATAGKEYWTGLKVEATDWKWSDGNIATKDTFKDPGFATIINITAGDILSGNNPSRAYCFLLSGNQGLNIEDCSQKHGFICEEFLGIPSSSAKATPMTTQIRPSISSTVTNAPVLTGASTIKATKAMRTSTLVSSMSPTAAMTPEKQIQEYFSKMKGLSVSNEDSLQIAVNETSTLLTRFHETSYPKKEANLLSATQGLEKFVASYAMKHLKTGKNSSRTTNRKNFVMTMQKINVGHKNDVTFPSDDNGKLLSYEGKEEIILPAELFKREEIVMVGILYKDMDKLLPDKSHTLLDGKRLQNARLRTRVIACSIVPKPHGVLQENVTILFTLEKHLKAEDKPHCVFWDFQETSRFNGSWSSKGCSLVNRTDTKVVCTCNHLTNFAVLMQIGEKKILAKHQAALEVITYIGCGLSLFGELMTVITYLVLMNLKQEQSQIRLNLVVAIAIAQIIFLAGINATARKATCIFVAVSIHYFYLTGFAWMLMEGIYLYLMVVKVFNTLVKMKLFYAFSWGFPCLMVVLSLVIASKTDDGIMSYVHSDFCWVSFSNNLVWTFAAPVLLVCLVNSVILCRVVCEMTKMQAAKDISNVKQGLKACVVLFPLLGMTWVFGVLSVTEAGLAFQYIFTVLNSLQGFFIFIMHVLRSSDVRAAFLRKKQKWETTKNSNFPSSRSAMEASNDFSEKYPIGNMRGATSSPDPLFRRHQVSPINSDTMNTRESCITPVDS